MNGTPKTAQQVGGSASCWHAWRDLTGHLVITTLFVCEMCFSEAHVPLRDKVTDADGVVKLDLPIFM